MNSKTKLSKSILDMKFMKKTKEKVELEDAEAEGRKMYENEITKKMLHGNTNILMEPSFVLIENLIDGRVSYRGMNPEIERLMELELQGTALIRATAEVDELRKMKTDVTDSDMLKFYSNLDNSMKKKFVSKTKRQRPADEAATLFHAKKGKFMKPKDED